MAVGAFREHLEALCILSPVAVGNPREQAPYIHEAVRSIQYLNVIHHCGCSYYPVAARLSQWHGDWRVHSYSARDRRRCDLA